MSLLRIIRRLAISPEFPAVVLAVLGFVVFTFLDDGIASLSNTKNVLSQSSTLMIMAVGLAVVMIAGHLDLSIGSIAALGAVVTISLDDRGLIVAIGVALAVCLFAGLVNGVLVTRVGIPSLIATLATLISFRGLAFLISDGRPIQGSRLSLALDIERARFGVFSVRILVMLAVLATVAFIMQRARWGRELYATGGSPDAARASGIPVDRRVVQAFALSGALAGSAGVIQALALNSASPRAQETALLTVVAAVVVGGVALTGGRGSVGGAFAGMLLISGVTVGMNRIGIDSAYQRVLLGSILILVVLITRAEATDAEGAMGSKEPEDKAPTNTESRKEAD